jgi:hypothetical protein
MVHHWPSSTVRFVFNTLLVIAFATISDFASACANCGCCRDPVTGEPFEVGQPLPPIPNPNPGIIPITPGSWTLAILPDTQHYAQSYPQHFTAQTQFLVDNKAALNIQYILHEGDIVNNNVVAQWNNARTSLGILDAGGMKYALAPGNHDYGPNGSTSDRTTYFHNLEYFGPGSPYAAQSSIGGFFEAGKTDNSWHTFSAGGNDWLVLALEFGPRNEVVTWADQVVTAHPNHKTMLVTHAYMYYDDTIYDWGVKGANQSWNPHSYGVANLPGGVNDGQELWDKLVKKHDNFSFTFNGHVLGDGTGYRATLGDNGNVVHQILANYQFNTQGGQGDMRLLEFLPDNETVIVRTYSPVLDRYNQAADQEFVLNLNALPPPPPVLSHAVLGNFVASGVTDPDTNIVEGLQVPQSSEPGMTYGQINRGDYQVAIGTQKVTYNQGIMMATITQHDRPDFLNRHATVEAGRNPYGDGFMSLSIMEAGVAGDNEVNFNTSVAWFAFESGWQGAHVNGNGTLAPGAFNGVTQSQVSRTAVGRYQVNLGVNSRTDGMLFVIGNNNDNIVVQTGPFADGSGWDVRVEDNATNHGATGEDRDWSFVYLPYDTPGLVGGYYDGLGNSHIASAGNFTMTKLGTGQYELSIPGETPETGMLILTVAHRATAASITAPDDNILVYQGSPTGKFLINSYDLPSVPLNLQDTMFVWAFLSFDDPLSLARPGDFDSDGDVDGADFVAWQTNFPKASGATLAQGDADGDGDVDGADFVVWQTNFPYTPGSGDSPVPEPQAALLALIGIATTFCLRRRRR